MNALKFTVLKMFVRIKANGSFMDGPMTFRRQVNDPFRWYLKQRINGCSNDIHALKHIVWGTFDIAQVLEVPRDDAVLAELAYKQAKTESQ